MWSGLLDLRWRGSSGGCHCGIDGMIEGMVGMMERSGRQIHWLWMKHELGRGNGHE